MKRSAEREMGSPLKRSRSLGHELRVLIPSRIAGSIIGKGGSNISRLRTEFKATVSVPDCPGPERLITVAADEAEITFSVLAEIVPLLDDGGRGERRAGGSTSSAEGVDGGGGGSGSVGGSGGCELRVLLHHSQVGCVIGKGGGKIKELRESSAAQIKVYGSCCPRSTDRVVAIAGSADVIMAALKQIVALAADSPVKGMADQYDPHNYEDVFAYQYGGWGEGGRGGGGGGGYERGGGGRGPPRGGGGRDDSYRSSSRGGGGGGGGGRYRNGDRGSGSDRSSRGSSSGGGGGHRSYFSPDSSNGLGRGLGGGGGGNGAGGDEGDYPEGERTTNQVTIPKEYAGAIIGKGGSRIRRIRADSGASITIDEALPGAPDRIITIAGAPGQIRMAQYLLQQSVKDHGELKEH